MVIIGMVFSGIFNQRTSKIMHCAKINIDLALGSGRVLADWG